MQRICSRPYQSIMSAAPKWPDYYCRLKHTWRLTECSVLLSQMLQLRRPGPPCQRVQVATPAQEVSFLPEHWPHGCKLPNQSTAVLAGFSGKTVPRERRRGGTQSLGTASRELWLKTGSWETEMPGEHRGQSNCFDGQMGSYGPLSSVEAALGTTSG